VAVTNAPCERATPGSSYPPAARDGWGLSGLPRVK
jgi:hypothetical protein